MIVYRLCGVHMYELMCESGLLYGDMYRQRCEKLMITGQMNVLINERMNIDV